MIWLIIVVEQVGIICRSKLVEFVGCQLWLVEANIVCSIDHIHISRRFIDQTTQYSERAFRILIDKNVRGRSFTHDLSPHLATFYLEDILNGLLEGIEECAHSVLVS